MNRRDAVKLLGGAAAAAAGLAVTGGVVAASGPVPSVFTGPGDFTSLKTAQVSNPASMFSVTTVYEVVARGAGLGVGPNNNQDDFSYLFGSVTGDGTFTCRVQKDTPTAGDGGYSSAGIMARASLDPGAVNVCVLCTDQNGVVFKWRGTQNDIEESWPMSIAIGVSAPIWVRLQKQGSNWTVSYSQDGVNWYNPTSTPVTFPSDTYLVGLCATTSDPKRMAIDEFWYVSGFNPTSFASIMPAATPPPVPSSSSSSSGY